MSLVGNDQVSLINLIQQLQRKIDMLELRVQHLENQKQIFPIEPIYINKQKIMKPDYSNIDDEILE